MNIGQVLQDRYQLDEIIGQGSMGVTYRALDLHTKRPVAVKLLHLSRIQEWKALEMFEREAKILQQLHHPRIPAYIDYCSSETAANAHFLLVQEYIEGKTLQQLVEKGWRGTEAEILDIFWQLVNILAYLHTLHPPVIHRDINPKNILMSSLNEVYLVDFGAVQERIRTTFLGGSTIVGTYGYVPYEQFSGHTVPASDYYAVGATLLYLFSHRHPADFATEDMKPRFREVIQTSPKVMALLDGLLEPSVKKRLATPDQVRTILDEHRPGVSSGTPFMRQEHASKPAWTAIERSVLSEHHLCFRFPKKIIGFLPGQATLDLTPEQIRFRDAYRIGKTVGVGWNVPTASLRPIDVTWHVERDKPVLGLNSNGRTLSIQVPLALAEVEWVVQEIRDYLSARYLAALPVATRLALEQRGTSSFFALPAPIKPPVTKVETMRKGDNARTFRIPRVAIPPDLTIKSQFGKELLEFISALLGKRVVEMTPTWIQVGNSYFGMKLGHIYHVPTAAVKATDINWYFKQMETGRMESKSRRLVVGINYAGRTVELGSHLTQAEAEWIIHEIGQYISEHATLTVDTVTPGHFEMK